MIAASVTVRVMGPGVSKLGASGRIPNRLSRPVVGLIPTRLLASLGLKMLPEVSVPTVPVANAIEPATPEPELDPLGSPNVYALRTWPPSELYPLGMLRSTQLANSDRFVLPRMIAP